VGNITEVKLHLLLLLLLLLHISVPCSYHPLALWLVLLQVEALDRMDKQSINDAIRKENLEPTFQS
jgi:hypothetical protein